MDKIEYLNKSCKRTIENSLIIGQSLKSIYAKLKGDNNNNVV